jgi:RHS repeat-associated protein
MAAGSCTSCTATSVAGLSSRSPIRYWDGSIYLYEPDIVTPYGGLFAHVRQYHNNPNGSAQFVGPNGFNWFMPQLPYTVADGSGNIAVVFDPNNPFWFSSGLAPLYGALDITLVNAGGLSTFTRNTAGGTESTVFNSDGSFNSNTDAAGVITTATYTGTPAQLTELQRQLVSGSTTTTESLLYTYYTSGAGIGYVQTVTYRRSTDGGVSWTNIQRMSYEYYDGTDANGNAGDLKTASSQNYNTSTSGWDTVAVSLYRYYQSGATSGFVHGLKLHLGPEAYRRAFNAGVNFDTDLDPVLQAYADHYFEYDPASPITRAVTLETAAVCTSCPGGGTTQDTFVYSSRGGTHSGINTWVSKVVQTLPNAATVTVYSDEVGMPLCEIYTDGTSKWCKSWRYDSNRSVIAQAEASAIDGSKVSETYDDLVDYTNASGVSAVMTSTGLVRITDYYASTGSGGVAGYIQNEKVQPGRATASAVSLRNYTYTAHTAGSNTVYLPSRLRIYPDATTTATFIDTAWSYTFQTGSNMLATRTTTLPSVPSGQNGDGGTYTVTETFDTFGNMVQRTDQLGTVNQYTFDVVLRAITQSVLNYVSGGGSAPGTNVTSDYTYDTRGRLTQALGPAHSIDLSSTATTVRTATWNVYIESTPVSGTWGLNEDRSAAGYATGAGPGYTYTLVDPVTLVEKDKAGRAIDQITSKRSTGTGALSASDTFVQTDWRSWKHSEYTDQGRLTLTRVYHKIPSTGTGSSPVNFGATNYAYDSLERVIQVTAPGGTITYTVWTSPQRVKEVWMGTDATAAKQADPAGRGSNNLKIVTANQYDGGSAGGDGTLTQVTQYASATDTRVTTFTYDFRNRRTAMDGEIDLYAVYSYDNLDRVTRVDRKNTNSAGKLASRNDTAYDNLGRVYQRITTAVDPSTGFIGNSLTEQTYYDGAGRVYRHIAPGDGSVFTQTAYSAVGWVTATYRGTGTGTLSGSLVVAQVENTYDEAGELIRQVSYDRLNDTTGNGPLSVATAPKGRASYTDTWPDGIGRTNATAAYGAVANFARSATAPARSDTVLVTQLLYSETGMANVVIDPAGIYTNTDRDHAGRVTAIYRDFLTPGPEVDFTYTLDNQIATQVAKSVSTFNQVTTYTYGTTLSTSDIARNDLLVSVTYPDSSGGTDVVSTTYNRLGQKTTVTDQRGTAHTYLYDKLGRQTDDQVTTVGTADGTVRRISQSYEVRGLIATVTSVDAVTGGTVLNQVQYAYNRFGQPTSEYQEHGGLVNTSTSPSVQYGYDSGASASNEIRPASLTYPNGRVITYYYDTSSDLNYKMNRVSSIKDGTTVLAAYTYLGAGTAVQVNYATEPGIVLDLWGGTSGVFNGIDRFGRVVDQRWVKSGTDKDRYQYGYDSMGNRLWKQNLVQTTLLDELYAYDVLNRLTQMQRGTLDTGHTTITGTPAVEQDWNLDETGNWSDFNTYANGTQDLAQSRVCNRANEITAITGTPDWADPTYDAAGNMTSLVKASSPTSNLTAIYDAWNRLVEVKDGASTVSKHRYDGLRRRIVKESYSGGSLTETRHFYVTNRWQNVEERVGAASTADVQYVWGARYVDDLVCRDDATPRRLYAMQDANFDLTAVCDTTGAVKERYKYAPYGERTVLDASWSALSASVYAWMIGHQGLLLDNDSDFYWVRNRVYSPLLGVWVQRDPAAHDGAETTSLYDYLYSSPTKFVDPSGASPLDLLIWLAQGQALCKSEWERFKGQQLSPKCETDFMSLCAQTWLESAGSRNSGSSAMARLIAKKGGCNDGWIIPDPEPWYPDLPPMPRSVDCWDACERIAVYWSVLCLNKNVYTHLTCAAEIDAALKACWNCCGGDVATTGARRECAEDIWHELLKKVYQIPNFDPREIDWFELFRKGLEKIGECGGE